MGSIETFNKNTSRVLKNMQSWLGMYLSITITRADLTEVFCQVRSHSIQYNTIVYWGFQKKHVDIYNRYIIDRDRKISHK